MPAPSSSNNTGMFMSVIITIVLGLCVAYLTSRVMELTASVRSMKVALAEQNKKLKRRPAVAAPMSVAVDEDQIRGLIQQEMERTIAELEASIPSMMMPLALGGQDEEPNSESEAEENDIPADHHGEQHSTLPFHLPTAHSHSHSHSHSPPAAAVFHQIPIMGGTMPLPPELAALLFAGLGSDLP